MIELTLIGLAITMYIFYSVNKSNRNRREIRREHLLEKQEEMIQMLKDKKNEEQNDEVSDTTKDE